MQHKSISILILLISLSCSVFGQNKTPITDRTITIKATSEPLGKVLDLIAETAGFTFSYSNQVLNTSKIVTIMAENRSVSYILSQLFKDEISYQQVGNHLVLQRAIKQKQKQVAPNTKTSFIISGYIRDYNNGEGVTNASIYDQQTLASATSADFGYYELKFTSDKSSHVIRFSKTGYRDTSFLVNLSTSNAIVNLNLQPIYDPILKPGIDSSQVVIFESPDSVTAVFHDTSAPEKISQSKVAMAPVVTWLTSAKQKIALANIKDSITRKSQITFFPPVGTNGVLSPLVSNDISLNLFVGYNGGVNKVEFGGFANIVRRQVNGAQFAGFANIVGGHLVGAQFAGFSNTIGGSVYGSQFAGFSNVALQEVNGAQFSGFSNITRGKLRGGQYAGFSNIAKQFMGTQVAGFSNLCYGNAYGAQIAGFANVAKNINGIQVAGFINVADTVRGAQIGFLNFARHSTGTSIAFMSFIKNGYHQIQVGTNELNYINVAYRSGTRFFYTILEAGTKIPSLFGSKSQWYYGYGVGSAIGLSKSTDLNIDLGWKHLNKGSYTDYINELTSINITANYKFNNTFSVYAGPSFNCLIANSNNPDYDATYSSLRKNYTFMETDGKYRLNGWFGFTAGVRFL
ncbi:MAG: hypothetical protein H7321_03430 [Bacteroidia bacterium]|nr:hypothetical protein [Bacteroidia bacterium]